MTMPTVPGIVKRDLPRWFYVVFAISCLGYSADHLVTPRVEECRVEAVKEVQVRMGAGRGATWVDWAVLDLSNGSGLEMPAGRGAFHVGDSLLVEVSPVFNVVRRYHRPSQTYWSDAGFSGDTEELFALVPVIGLLALLLVADRWSEDTRTMLRLVLMVLLFVWLLYMLGIHGPRLLA
jgi:hypothetical protein